MLNECEPAELSRLLELCFYTRTKQMSCLVPSLQLVKVSTGRGRIRDSPQVTEVLPCVPAAPFHLAVGEEDDGSSVLSVQPQSPCPIALLCRDQC